MPQKPKQFKPQHTSGNNKFDGRKHITDLYDSDWERYRLRFLSVNGRCYSCGVTASVVDHLQTHKGDKIMFEKLDNHIPLCSKCHNYITAKFDRYGSQKYWDKLKWMAENRSRNNIDFRVFVLPRYRD